jgi:hypothetical protein
LNEVFEGKKLVEIYLEDKFCCYINFGNSASVGQDILYRLGFNSITKK